MSSKFTRAVVVLLLAAWCAGCAESSPVDGNAGQGGGGPALPGTGGVGGTGATGGVGGTGATGGVGGTAGLVAAGAGGTGGGEADAGAAGGTDGGSLNGGGGTFIRGPEPTAESASKPGPFGYEKYTDGFKQGTKYKGGTVYYPVKADPKFAMVVVCPGWTATQDSIGSWGPFYATHGIVALTIDTNTTNDSVVQRAEALLDALADLRAENDRQDSPLFGKLDVMRAGLSGWSMGGGATWINASAHPELKTAVSLAGHMATAGGAGVAPNITVPAMLCAGSEDDLLLGGGMSQPMYDIVPETTPKLIYEVEGGTHNVCNTWQSVGGAVGRYVLSWQKVFLEGDERYRQFLTQTPPQSLDYRTTL
jgi:dienelactone hydrolase